MLSSATTSYLPQIPPDAEPPDVKERPNFSHLRRAKKRKRDAELIGQIPRKKIVEKYLTPAVTLSSDVKLLSLPVYEGAYGAKLEKREAEYKMCYRLEDLIRQGFEVVHWDGRYVHTLCIFQLGTC